MLTNLWDSHGTAVAYIDDDHESVYLQDGSAVAWISGVNLYSYRGRLLGWYYQGWVIDLEGKCLLFSERAQPGAVRPFTRLPEDRGDKALRPSRSVPDPSRKRPSRAKTWSSIDARTFFTQ
jgi:hypothetical protein